jgi:two-component system, cell cycle sensor histidine kinase and response regulator CckA
MKNLKFPYSRKAILLIVFVTITAGVGIYYGISRYLIGEAKRDIQDILLSHRGLHQYIQYDMHPAFYDAVAKDKIEETYYDPVVLSSSYIVRVLNGYHNQERKKIGLSEVYYKMAADNPRNPVNMASDYESGILALFNENRELKEFQDTIRRDGKHYLVYAAPFLETTKDCLKCHGDREEAPPGLQAAYPGEGGFHDRVGNIRAIESIMVPVNDRMILGYVTTGSISAGLLMLLALLFFTTRLRGKVSEQTRELEAEIEIRKATEENISRAL